MSFFFFLTKSSVHAYLKIIDCYLHELIFYYKKPTYDFSAFYTNRYFWIGGKMRKESIKKEVWLNSLVFFFSLLKYKPSQCTERCTVSFLSLHLEFIILNSVMKCWHSVIYEVATAKVSHNLR